MIEAAEKSIVTVVIEGLLFGRVFKELDKLAGVTGRFINSCSSRALLALSLTRSMFRFIACMFPQPFVAFCASLSQW
jgi:hypothetical protein